VSGEARDTYIEELEEFVKEMAGLRHAMPHDKTCPDFKCRIGQMAQAILDKGKR